jgi:hypothetical protein
MRMTDTASFGRLERCLHRLAFATSRAQLGIADLEARLFRRELATVAPAAPVFVTALPRAGTTVLLELLAGCPEFAAHTYSDMPFVLCPLLWQRLSRPFRRRAEPRERAHGDGLMIAPDSPEAFEEMIWMAFHADHYRPDLIRPWSRCDDPEFVAFLNDNMRKVVLLRRRDKPTARRYVSKNNVQLARVPSLWSAWPDAVVVVAFRDPLQHAASLLRQHQRFLALHAEQPFARRYMAGVGHFDFGANLKPIDFGGWLQDGSVDAGTLGFWIDYWLAAYRHVLAHAGDPRLVLVRFESLVAGADLAGLAARVGLDDPAELQHRAAMLRSAAPHRVDPAHAPADRAAAARELYQQLAARALS